MCKACLVSIVAALLLASARATITEGRGGQEKEAPPPAKSDTTKKLLTDLDRADKFVRAAAIDLLGQRKAKEAIPRLIDLLTDDRALIGSDNWVGLHAANALTAITGRPFSLDQQAWQGWWDGQKKQSSDANPTDQALLNQVKDLAQQVRKSDLIVVGRLSILTVRDGYLGGTIQVSEVLFGKVGAKEISFNSEHLALEEHEEHIWFLSRPAGDRDPAAEIAWRLQSGGAAAAEKDAVRWLIEKIKQPKQGLGPGRYP
jgi:hypothetical protein